MARADEAIAALSNEAEQRRRLGVRRRLDACAREFESSEDVIQFTSRYATVSCSSAFSACQSNCDAAYPAVVGDYSSDWTGQSCDTICYDPEACPGSAPSLADGYDPAYCSRSETGTFSDCDSEDIPCGAFTLAVDYQPYGEGLCPDSITDSGCASTTLLRVGCDSDDCQGTPPFYDDGACMGPNKGCDEACTPSDCADGDLSCQDSLCIQKDASKDNYGRHLFSSRSCDADCDSDCNLFCTGGSSRRRHKKSKDCGENDCNDLSIFTPSETNGRRRCGPTDANSKFSFVGADSGCSSSCDGALCDDWYSSGYCENSWDVALDYQTQWNAAASALPNPTVAFSPYPKDGVANIAESEVFRGCNFSLVDVSYTDSTGSPSTQQKPHCDWEGFTDGKYMNGWGGCDWGGCDEWS